MSRDDLAAHARALLDTKPLPDSGHGRPRRPAVHLPGLLRLRARVGVLLDVRDRRPILPQSRRTAAGQPRRLRLHGRDLTGTALRPVQDPRRIRCRGDRRRRGVRRRTCPGNRPRPAQSIRVHSPAVAPGLTCSRANPNPPRRLDHPGTKPSPMRARYMPLALAYEHHLLRGQTSATKAPSASESRASLCY